ncbi:NAD-dependent epimerase/dehydratase family protein [Sphingobacterium olei]|uniref:NAD-dependent epimerase/dehydratase family protein n=1 Tax=Sphingobacterium olei TaxID=2571155 RepID=A0A4U0NZE4_9SPHI|nr:NAD-dependent epimerase/dehydratase family protein [Sphingobacterium olei]TJZ60110.1 NAD-dependent epimerase/dehydratase family protein [Sphingobacterium olei]
MSKPLIKVLGSSGFIGKSLTDFLNKKSFQVEVLSLRTVNWRNYFETDAHTVVNLIGKAHDHRGVATEQEYYYSNFEIVKDVFEKFTSTKMNLFIHISSLAALEEFESGKPLTEVDLCNPQSLYGKSKCVAEEWLMSQEIPTNKKLIILRPPMVHGPGDRGNLGLLYKLISKGIPYPLASFENSRSFISIDNFCFFIEQIIKNQDKMESGIYHIADDEPVSTSEIIQIIQNITGRNTLNLSLPKFIVKAIAKVGDVIPIPLNSKRLKKMTSNLIVSNTKIKEALGIEKLPLSAREGLEKTIRSFRDL